MKVQIRQGVFETNSSSVHSLVFPKGECSEKLRVNKYGVVQISCGDFQDYGAVCGLHEKLSYLCTYVVLDSFWDGKLNKISSEDNWNLKNILMAIQRRYPEVKELVATKCNKAYFDHQTAPSESSCIVNLDSVDELEGFLFNDEIMIRMDRD